MISALHLTRMFGARAVVEDVTFDVGRGEIVALLGPNGAGKTTTLRVLAGLIAPTRGSVAIDGIEFTPATAGALRRRIGFLTEAPGLWERLTVRENLRVYAGIYGIARPDRVIDGALDLLDLADRGSTRAAELSKGMRQKVALARALLHDPMVLLLDEPTSGLDPEITRGVRRLLAERRSAGRSILVSTHNLDEAERLADRVAVIHRRLLALDRPDVLRRRLSTGRAIVRLASDGAPYLAVARAFDAHAKAEGSTIVVSLRQPERNIPDLVRALVDSGARIIEVRPETPDLEDVYLDLVGNGERPR